ncbi:hypothetical protein V6U80_02885 [Micromonospora sp. CPCC 205543]
MHSPSQPKQTLPATWAYMPIRPWPLRFGQVRVVPGALVPVHCDVIHGQAVYVEPNVSVRHRL